MRTGKVLISFKLNPEGSCVSDIFSMVDEINYYFPRDFARMAQDLRLFDVPKLQ